MHALVLLRPSGTTSVDEAVETQHEGFIDELDDADKVVLGGGFEPPIERIEGAYLISCASLQEARAIADSDPFVRLGAYRYEVVEWTLVGVNPEAVDRSALLFP
jgi:uncharacterized protein YciI